MNLLNHLNFLEASSLLSLAQTAPELEFMFRHSLVQETAYSSLLKHQRQEIHLAAGKALEELYIDQLYQYAPLLARHFYEAGDEHKALQYYELAGNAASKVYANAEAFVHFERAIEIARKIVEQGDGSPTLKDLYLNAGAALERGGEFGKALKLYLDMENFGCSRGDQSLELGSLIAQTTILSIPSPISDLELGRSTGERALALAEAIQDGPAQAKVYWSLLLLHFFNDRIDQALDFGEKSLSLARQYNLREQIAYTLNDLASFPYLATGEYERGLAALSEAREIWRELDNLHMLSDNLTESGYTSMMNGEFQIALQLTEEGHNLSRSLSNLWGQAFSLGVLGFIYLPMGELQKALPILEESIALGDQGGFQAARIIGRSLQSFIHSLYGDFERGYQYGREAVALAETQISFWRPTTYCSLAMGFIYEGNFPEADRLIERSRLTGQKDHRFFYSPIIPFVECEYWLNKKDYHQALNLANIFLEGNEPGRNKFFLPYAYYFKGFALSALGRPEEGFDEVQEAIRISQGMNHRQALWRSLAKGGEIELNRENPRSAENFFQEAWEVINFLADHAGSQSLRDSFMRLPQVQLVTAHASAGPS